MKDYMLKVLGGFRIFRKWAYWREDRPLGVSIEEDIGISALSFPQVVIDNFNISSKTSQNHMNIIFKNEFSWIYNLARKLITVWGNGPVKKVHACS